MAFRKYVVSGNHSNEAFKSNVLTSWCLHVRHEKRMLLSIIVVSIDSMGWGHWSGWLCECPLTSSYFHGSFPKLCKKYERNQELGEDTCKITQDVFLSRLNSRDKLRCPQGLGRLSLTTQIEWQITTQTSESRSGCNYEKPECLCLVKEAAIT